ncbi:uncharacterized protein [Antedon mediterranea]|uniref:uncharacterized protein n=1 Tax=Antedon mediterranea TaxID=105859 RepID=UPI003AF52E31
MGIMCCCYVKKNDDYESLDPKSAESPAEHHKYGTLESGGSARPPETKRYQYPKSPLRQKFSSDSEQRSVRHVRVHVSSSDSDESDDDSPPPIRAYSSAPAKTDKQKNAAPITKEHAPVVASPSITIEGEEEGSPKTVASGLASIFKPEDSAVSEGTKTAEGTRVDAEGASAAESTDPEDSTGGHSNVSGNQNGSLDSLNGSEKKTKKSKSMVRKVGSSMKRASRKASKSMQKGMAKMLHPNKSRDSTETDDKSNAQHKGQQDSDDDETEWSRDDSSLVTPTSPMSPANLLPEPPSPRSPRSISPAHSPISPGRHRTMSYGRRSPSSPSAHQPLTRMSSDKMQSKYARERMLEREKQWSKIEAEAESKEDVQKTSAIGQALNAAYERGQRLKEVEETSDAMRESAFSFAESAKQLKEKKRKSAKY